MSDFPIFAPWLLVGVGVLVFLFIVTDAFIYDMWRDEWRWKSRKRPPHNPT